MQLLYTSDSKYLPSQIRLVLFDFCPLILFYYIYSDSANLRLGTLFRCYPRNKSRHVFIMIRVSGHVRRPAWLVAIRFYTLTTFISILRSTRWTKLYEHRRTVLLSFEIQIIAAISRYYSMDCLWAISRLIYINSAHMWISFD